MGVLTPLRGLADRGMASTTRSRMGLPVRHIRKGFPMTPLADAMFQLLIFFMLASSLSPYSLLEIQGGAGPADSAAIGDETTTQAPSDATLRDAVLWHVGAGEITIAAQSFSFDRLGDLAGALGTPAAPADVVILIESGASVQDLTTVLEALKKGDVASVHVATQEG